MNASSVVLDHFQAPRNMGPLAPPFVEGVAGVPPGRPFIRIQLRVEDDTVVAAGFLTFGCVAAIAAGSYLTSWAIGKRLAQARQATGRWLLESLGGLPRSRAYCAALAVEALHRAIDNAAGGENTK